MSQSMREKLGYGLSVRDKMDRITVPHDFNAPGPLDPVTHTVLTGFAAIFWYGWKITKFVLLCAVITIIVRSMILAFPNNFLLSTIASFAIFYLPIWAYRQLYPRPL